MWVLCLNDMRAHQIEILTPVCRASTREELVRLLEREKVDGYRDGSWGKTYRRGGPLEWFNPPWDFEADRHFINVGTRDDIAVRAAEAWDHQILPLPECHTLPQAA